jgi:predicted acyltransferase
MTSDRHHLESLDVVRGMTIAAMILVNNPGDWNSVFPPLLHADWNGWTFARRRVSVFRVRRLCAMPFASRAGTPATAPSGEPPPACFGGRCC